MFAEESNSVSAEELLALIENNAKISKARFLPPKIGQNSFGSFILERKNKTYNKTAHVR